MTDQSVSEGHEDEPIKPDGVVCGAAGRQGRPCQKPAGWATDHVGTGRCKLHGGSTPNHVVAAKRIQASGVLATYGLPRTGKQDPRDLLMEELNRTFGHIDWLADIIRRMDPEALTMGITSMMEGERPAGKDGIPSAVWEIVEGAAPSVWLKLYQWEREFGYKVAKDTAALGLLERAVQLEEAQAGLMATVMIRMGDRLGLTAEQQALWPLMLAEELRAIDAAESVVASATDPLRDET
jgi:hypothetical protein